MEKGILNHSSYEETLRSLSKYHKKIMADVCFKFKFPNMSTNPFIALRKNVEIGFLCCTLMEWEREAVFGYGKKHVFEEYYPVIFDYIKQVVIPHKCEDYSCNIAYFHIFPPFYYGDMICSFFVNFFEKPIFKNFNLLHNALEQEIVTQISTFFRKQNKYGPEQISVAILDDQFVTIMISGLLTPFLREFINTDSDGALIIEKIFIMQTKKVLEEIFIKYFNSKTYEPFIYFDKHNDKMIVLSSLSKDQWINFLERMCT